MATWPDQHENLMAWLAGDSGFGSISVAAGYNTDPHIQRYYELPQQLSISERKPAIMVLPGPMEDDLSILSADPNTEEKLRLDRTDEIIIIIVARGTDATDRITALHELQKAVHDVTRIIMENPTLGGYVNRMERLHWTKSLSVGHNIFALADGSLRVGYSHNPLA